MKKTACSFHYGKICKKHPELLGARYTSSRSCPECVVEYRKKRRTKLGRTYQGVVCSTHPGLEGLRYTLNSRCTACHTADSKMRARVRLAKAKRQDVHDEAL